MSKDFSVHTSTVVFLNNMLSNLEVTLLVRKKF